MYLYIHDYERLGQDPEVSSNAMLPLAAFLLDVANGIA